MRTTPPIGVDLGTHTIKAVQLDREGAPLAAASIRRDTPGQPITSDDVARLSGVLYRRGFVGRRVAIVAPKSAINRITIDLPPLDSGAPIDAIAQTELCRQRRIEPGTFEYRWYESPQPPRHASGARAIAVSCTHEEADGVLDLFEAHGMTPIAFHSPDAVLADMVGGATSPRATAVLDLGWTDATIVAARSGTVRFVRAIQGCGLGELAGDERWFAASLGSALRDALASGIDRGDGNNSEDDQGRIPAEFNAVFKRYRGALAAEVVSSLQYLEGCGRDEMPQLLVITGGGSGVPGVRAALMSATGIETAVTLDGPHGLLGAAAAVASTPRIPGEVADAHRPQQEGAAA